MADVKDQIGNIQGAYINRIKVDQRGNLEVQLWKQPGWMNDDGFHPQGEALNYSVTFPTSKLKDRQVQALNLIQGIDCDGDGKPVEKTRLWLRGNMGFTVSVKPKREEGYWVNIYARVAPWTEVSLTPFPRKGESRREVNSDPEEVTVDDMPDF